MGAPEDWDEAFLLKLMQLSVAVIYLEWTCSIRAASPEEDA